MTTWKATVAIDPGGTTGLAYRARTGEVVTCTTSTPEELVDFLRGEIIDRVVIEDFIAERINKYGLYTVRLVGLVQGVCLFRGIPLIVQRNFDRKSYIVDAKMHLQGTRYVIHEVDALAHLFTLEAKDAA